MIIVLDELSRFYSRDAASRSDLGEPFVLQMLRTSRQKGICLILADQTYALFHEVIRSNAQTKVIFETKDGPSRHEIARDLDLTGEQRSFLNELSWGQENRRVVVQLPDYPRPFLMALSAWEKPAKLTFYTPPDFAWTPLPEPKPKEQKKRDPNEVTREMEKYLEICACNQWYTETQHDREMNFPQAKGNRIRQELKDAGLLEEHQVRTGRRGGTIKIAIPSNAGYEYLDRRKIGYTPLRGNGSIQHKFWQHKIAEWLRKKGWRAEIEMNLGNKQVDVGCVMPGLIERRVAYEVVWDDDLDKEVSNLVKNLEDSWEHVVFCVLDDETSRALVQKLGESVSESDDRFEVRLLKEFL